VVNNVVASEPITISQLSTVEQLRLRDGSMAGIIA
jgi:hypothetical protein